MTSHLHPSLCDARSPPEPPEAPLVLRRLRIRLSCRRDTVVVLPARSKCGNERPRICRLLTHPVLKHAPPPHPLTHPPRSTGFALGQTAALLGFSAYTVVTVAALLAVTFRRGRRPFSPLPKPPPRRAAPSLRPRGGHPTSPPGSRCTARRPDFPQESGILLPVDDGVVRAHEGASRPHPLRGALPTPPPASAVPRQTHWGAAAPAAPRAPLLVSPPQPQSRPHTRPPALPPPPPLLPRRTAPRPPSASAPPRASTAASPASSSSATSNSPTGPPPAALSSTGPSTRCGTCGSASGYPQRRG